MTRLKQTAGSPHTTRMDQEVWRKEEWMKIRVIRPKEKYNKNNPKCTLCRRGSGLWQDTSISVCTNWQHFSSLRCYLKSMVLQPPKLLPCLENKECHQCHTTSTLVICVNALRAFSKQQSLCRCDCDTNKQNQKKNNYCSQDWQTILS